MQDSTTASFYCLLYVVGVICLLFLCGSRTGGMASGIDRDNRRIDLLSTISRLALFRLGFLAKSRIASAKAQHRIYRELTLVYLR